MRLPSEAITAYGTEGVEIGPLAVVDPESDRVTVHLARVSPGGTIGRHPTTYWQVFAVVAGTGWVAGEDGVRRPVAAADGEAVLWSPGEVHESGSDDGMLVVIVESRTRPNEL